MRKSIFSSSTIVEQRINVTNLCGTFLMFMYLKTSERQIKIFYVTMPCWYNLLYLLLLYNVCRYLQSSILLRIPFHAWSLYIPTAIYYYLITFLQYLLLQAYVSHSTGEFWRARTRSKIPALPRHYSHRQQTLQVGPRK